VQLHAPDAVEDAVAQRAGRELHLSPSIDGTWFGRFTLDPIDGTIVAGEIARLERELFDRDWADAKERLGRVPVVGDLARTPAQRRADALVIMATRSATTPPGGRAPAPLFTVFVDVETLTTLDNGRLACGYHNRRRNTTTHTDDPDREGEGDPP
jgi:hypothetical protein